MSLQHGVRTGAGLLLILAIGCGPAAGPRKGPFTAVWSAHDSAPLAARDLEALAAAGVTEVFFQVATLAWEGDLPVLQEALAAPLPRAFPATLVITGPWHQKTAKWADIGESWASRLEGLALAAERRGATPVGFHFALDGADSDLGGALVALRRNLHGRYVVSVDLSRRMLESESGRSLAKAVDFVTVFGWGQSPTEGEDPARWDLKLTAATFEHAARLGRPWAAGAWTSASVRGRGAAAEGGAQGLTLAQLLRAPGLEPRLGSVLESLDRQVVEVIARSPARVGPWSFATGDSVRVVRASTPDLESFLAALPPAGTGRIGTVLRQLPASGDALSLAPASLAEALAPGPAEPRLEALVEELPARGDRFRFRVVLVNRGPEPTDLAAAGANRLELRLSGGVLAAVEPGQFSSWEQLWQGRESRTLRALREPDTLRLSTPWIGGGERLASGPIEVRRRGSAAPTLRIDGSFLVASGKILELPELDWSFGAQP